MNLPIPDRISINKHSIYYKPAFPVENLIVKVNGEVQTTVIEYCISQGWVRRYRKDANGRYIMNNGNIAVERIACKIEVSWRD